MADQGLELREVEEVIPEELPLELILGDEIECNPFDVANVTQAWNNLYPKQAREVLPATHKYVKFTPTEAKQVFELYKQGDIQFYTYPLDRKVIQLGRYYNHPEKSENDLPDLYTVVEKDFPLESINVPFEVIDEWIKIPYHSALYAESFRLCGIPYKEVSDDPELRLEDCTPDCDNYPCCYIPFIDCDGPIDPRYLDECDEWEPDCYPEHPDWPDCLDPDFENGGGNPTTGSCACDINAHERRPSGCVRVQDPVGNGFSPVRNVPILVSGVEYPQFIGMAGMVLFAELVKTDDYGCWKAKRKRFGSIWLRIIFSNEVAYVRGVDFEADLEGLLWNELLWSNLIPVVEKRKVEEKPFNNIRTNLARWTVEGTQEQRAWCAAQTINHIQEMHEMCSDEGINSPPYIDTYLMIDQTSAAWMGHYNGVNSIIWTDLVDFILGGPLGDVMNSTSFILPDIFLDRNTAHRNYRGTAYHEMAHSSHFTNVGSDWWQHLTQQEFTNPGHGNGTEPDAGYVAVGESWANHIGILFDQGPGILESDIFEPNAWLPEGLHHDLFDANTGSPTEPPGPWPLYTVITDNISGFTNAMIFDVLDEDVISIGDYEDQLWNNYGTSPGVSATLSDYTILFNSYGF